jgi:3',5'-cyclic AMP phosphodiesterase CpdA
MKKNLLTLMLLCSSMITYSQEIARGYVYDDANNNGKKERSEAGIPKVAVSNGIDVVLTDAKGCYAVPVSEGNTLFVIKPSGYKTAVDNDYIPQFHYHHKPKGSPATTTYKGVSPTGKMPTTVDFALYKYNEPEHFSAIVFGDPQPYSLDDLDYFTRKIVDDVKKTEQTLFGISLGDIVGDNLDLQPVYKERMRRLQLPWYNVMGNHDMNYDAPTDELSDETFERNFGSANYAFNYGNAHFIIIDNILYPDPRDGNGYWGGYRLDQLLFLENNLKHIPKDKLIVLSQHIHMKDEAGYRTGDRQRLFDLLKDFDNVLIMSAHTHLQDQIEYTIDQGWQGKKPLHEFNVGTTSGDWYSGKMDDAGLPDATMRDGTPQGYLFLNINGNRYDVDYKVAGKSAEYQMHIYASKVVRYKGATTPVVVNFFMGSKNDLVEYRIDKGAWQKMRYTEAIDPSYLTKLIEWDFTDKLLPGRRPSNAENSTHLWSGSLKTDLPPGEHTIEVRATDRYGKQHVGSSKYTILE